MRDARRSDLVRCARVNSKSFQPIEPDRSPEPEPVALATWGRWCGAGLVRRTLWECERDLYQTPHCAICDRRPVGLALDGLAYTLMHGRFHNGWRWVTGFHLGRAVMSRAGHHVRFEI